MKVRLLFYIISITIFLGCSVEEPVSYFCTVNGTIIDKVNYEPMQGALVSLMPSGNTCVTGSDGKYSFSDLDSGDYTVSVSKSGYTTDSKLVTLKPSLTTSLDFTIDKANGVLVLSKSSLDFGKDNLSLSFSIENAGNNSLTYNIDNQYDWLVISPNSATVESGRIKSITAVIDRSLINEYKAVTLPISSDAGTAELQIVVDYDEPKPILSVTETSLDFKLDVVTDYIHIKNSGNLDLTFELSGIEEWFSIKCSEYTLSAGESTTLTVTIDRSKLTQSNSHKLDINSNGGSASVAINVSNEVPTPELMIEITEVDFGNSSSTETFVVSNLGDATLNFEIDEDVSWLSSSYTGSVDANSSVVVTLNIDRANIYGQASQIISITSNSGDKDITVKAYEEVTSQMFLSDYSSTNYPSGTSTWVIGNYSAKLADFDGLKAALSSAKDQGMSISLVFSNLEMIPNSITGVGSALKDCTALVSVSLPAAIKIGSRAFVGCSNLRAVDMPLVTEVGEACFQSCESIVEINLPSLTTFGGSHVFALCSNLKRINISTNSNTILDSIGRAATNSTNAFTYDYTNSSYNGNTVSYTTLTIGEANKDSVNLNVLTINGSSATFNNIILVD